MRNVYRLSSAIGAHRIPTFASGETTFGRAHYSWSINAELYLKGLREIREVTSIQAPDIYQHEIAYEVAGISANVTHLADKPIEMLRPMFGHRNVAIIVWEFAEFSDNAINGDPRTNQLHMLRQMDDVWCGSSFTQRNLAAVGIGARMLPPPVAHFITSESESIDAIPCVALDSEGMPSASEETIGDLVARAQDRPIFLAVLAPYDLRKNLPALIEGFLDSNAAKDGILLIKLVIDNVVTTVANINQIVLKFFNLKVKSEHVVFCGAYLSVEQMNSLYGISSFYVSAASAEGLNLPLIETMGRGLPAITPDHTAMADYVSGDRAIVVPAERQPTEGPIHALVPHLATTHYPPTKAAMSAAFDRAIQLDEAERLKLGKRGAAFVKKNFGLKEFEKRISDYERPAK
jgi:hypothetical protein